MDAHARLISGNKPQKHIVWHARYFSCTIPGRSCTVGVSGRSRAGHCGGGERANDQRQVSDGGGSVVPASQACLQSIEKTHSGDVWVVSLLLAGRRQHVIQVGKPGISDTLLQVAVRVSRLLHRPLDRLLTRAILGLLPAQNVRLPHGEALRWSHHLGSGAPRRPDAVCVSAKCTSWQRTKCSFQKLELGSDSAERTRCEAGCRSLVPARSVPRKARGLLLTAGQCLP